MGKEEERKRGEKKKEGEGRGKEMREGEEKREREGEGGEVANERV